MIFVHSLKFHLLSCVKYTILSYGYIVQLITYVLLYVNCFTAENLLMYIYCCFCHDFYNTKISLIEYIEPTNYVNKRQNGWMMMMKMMNEYAFNWHNCVFNTFLQIFKTFSIWPFVCNVFFDRFFSSSFSFSCNLFSFVARFD